MITISSDIQDGCYTRCFCNKYGPSQSVSWLELGMLWLSVV